MIVRLFIEISKTPINGCFLGNSVDFIKHSWTVAFLDNCYLYGFFFSLFIIKGALSGLRQFLATECPLKMMKNAFCFTLKALFVLKIYKFLAWIFVQIEK